MLRYSHSIPKLSSCNKDNTAQCLDIAIPKLSSFRKENTAQCLEIAIPKLSSFSKDNTSSSCKCSYLGYDFKLDNSAGGNCFFRRRSAIPFRKVNRFFVVQEAVILSRLSGLPPGERIVFRIARAGIFPRSSLFGAGQLGFGDLEGVG